MSDLRDTLAADLAAKIERYGVVVWDDPEAAYAGVVSDVVPPGVGLHRFEGSWFEVRQAVEAHLAGAEPPRLVIYVPTKAPSHDPLEELRAVGTRYRITLPTLVRSALSGQVSEHRLTQIANQCTTVTEVEAAMAAADSSVDARLISLVGESSTRTLVARLMSGRLDEELAERGLTDAVRSTISTALGGDYTGVDGRELRLRAFRHAVLAIIQERLGGLPEALTAAFDGATTAQIRNCHSVIEALQAHRDLHGAYVELAESVDEQLDLVSRFEWSESLATVDVTASIEDLAIAEGIRRLQASENEEARRLAEQRLTSSWWLKPDAPHGESLASKWRAVALLAALGSSAGAAVPRFATVSQLMDWYVSDGWRVDSNYRQSEYVRVTAGSALDEFDELYHRARKAYERWLDKVLTSSCDAFGDVDVEPESLQRSIHSRYVDKPGGRCAYVLVDALRYELAQDLAARLHSVNAEVAVTAAFGTAPSITPVGMAAVLPHASTSFEVDLGPNDRLTVKVGREQVARVSDRVRLLEHAHGKVVNLELDRVAQFSNKELKSRVADADLVLVRSTEIDADGESDQLAASWGSFDTTLSVLHTAVAKLLHAGLERVVITADHGFLAVRQLGEDRRIDKPVTGQGEQHRRAWIGRGGTASESTIKVPLAAFGIAGGLDIITPRGLGVFVSGGGLQFFHGGLSPQELIVPVIAVTSAEKTPEPKYSIELEVAGGRITTGVIAVRITMTGDLFTRESRIRLELLQEGKRVAAVVGGDGFDEVTETIDASVEQPRMVTMKATANISSGVSATLEVLDAATGVRLQAMDVPVATDIVVEEALD